jgi:hypothetical protein
MLEKIEQQIKKLREAEELQIEKIQAKYAPLHQKEAAEIELVKKSYAAKTQRLYREKRRLKRQANKNLWQKELLNMLNQTISELDTNNPYSDGFNHEILTDDWLEMTLPYLGKRWVLPIIEIDYMGPWITDIAFGLRVCDPKERAGEDRDYMLTKLDFEKHDLEIKELQQALEKYKTKIEESKLPPIGVLMKKGRRVPANWSMF